MQIPVLLERTKGNGYRARCREPLTASARGATPQVALGKLQAKIQGRLKKGTEVVGLEIGTAPHPWMEFAGMFKDDPLFEDWQNAIAEYRRKVDEDPTDYEPAFA